VPGIEGDSIFSTEVGKNRSPRSSCSAPARDRCGRRKDEDFILSDEHKLDLYVPSLTSASFTVMSRSAPG
jgi:hypothetical protein